MAGVTLNHVTKSFRDGTVAVDDLSLDVSDGEFVVFVGPSGSGKTTALRLVAGLEILTAGEIMIGGRVVNDIDPGDRDIAMVFQNYALYPHMNVAKNIGFGLRMRGVQRREMERRVREMSSVLNLDEHLHRKPRQLSGGQRQRVAMGRALIRDPQAFLMDEPLSNLDAKLRVQMRAEVLRIQRDLDVTTIYVTHDQIEAMTMGDRVAVIHHGKLQQLAIPQTLFDEPSNLFVATFIGSPAMNILHGRLASRDGDLVCFVGDDEIVIPRATRVRRPSLARYESREIGIGIRPEHVEDAALATGHPDGVCLRGRLNVRQSMGSEMLVHVELNARPVLDQEALEGVEANETILTDPIDFNSMERGAILVGRFGIGSRVQPGELVDVVVDTRYLHFFDLESGHAIDGPGGHEAA